MIQSSITVPPNINSDYLAVPTSSEGNNEGFLSEDPSEENTVPSTSASTDLMVNNRTRREIKAPLIYGIEQCYCATNAFLSLAEPKNISEAMKRSEERRVGKECRL